MSGLIPTLQQHADRFGPVRGNIGSRNPYDTQAQALESEFRAAAQLVGKAMEGGVLRKEDEIKYRKMLPNLGDTPEVAAEKIRVVQQMLQQQLQTKQQIYSSYDTIGGPQDTLPDIEQLLGGY